MIRAPRLVLCILLVLTQVLAPWVHAHMGVETGGFLHLPGLEMAAKTAPGCAAEASPGDRDVIVVMQAGVWDPSKPIPPDRGQANPPALSPSQPALACVQPAHALPLATAPPMPYPVSFYRSHPRAPPRA